MRRIPQLFAWIIGLGGMASAMSGADGFLVIPTAPILPHQSYQIEGTLGYHMSEQSGVLADRHPYVSGFRLGLANQFELGMQYGEKISLEAKIRLVEEDGMRPVLTLGMRQIAASQEAYFYSVPAAQAQAYAGEFFVASSLGNNWFRAHGGLSILSGLDSNKACPFWGAEQKMGLGTGILYEGFLRDGRSHHNLGLQWEFAHILRLSAGATEFHRYFVQDGEIGFQIKGSHHPESGYRAPGVYAAIALTGFMKKESWPDTRAELQASQKRIAVQEEQLRDLQARMDEFELNYAESQGRMGDSLNQRTIRTEQSFDAIVQAYQQDIWDIDDLRAKQSAFLDLKGPAHRLLLRTAKLVNAQPHYRETAIRVMGISKNAQFVEPLRLLLNEDPDENLRREAALSLGSIATPEAKNAIQAAIPLTQGSLRSTLEQILKTFAP